MSLTREQIEEGEQIMGAWNTPHPGPVSPFYMNIERTVLRYFAEHGPALLAAAKERDALAECVAGLEKALRDVRDLSKCYDSGPTKLLINEALGASRTEASE